MSKALLQQHAAKAVQERVLQEQQQHANEEQQLRLAQQIQQQAQYVQQQAQYVQQQVLQVQQAQRALQVQQAELDLRAQTITQVNRDNAALRAEVDKLIIELNDYDAAALAACEDSTEVAELISPLLPAYNDLSPTHGFEDYQDISVTGECKE